MLFLLPFLHVWIYAAAPCLCGSYITISIVWLILLIRFISLYSQLLWKLSLRYVSKSSIKILNFILTLVVYRFKSAVKCCIYLKMLSPPAWGNYPASPTLRVEATFDYWSRWWQLISEILQEIEIYFLLWYMYQKAVPQNVHWSRDILWDKIRFSHQICEETYKSYTLYKTRTCSRVCPRSKSSRSVNRGIHRSTFTGGVERTILSKET